MLKCSECGTEISEQSAQLCKVDWCPNLFCMKCYPSDGYCKVHGKSKEEQQKHKQKQATP